MEPAAPDRSVPGPWAIVDERHICCGIARYYISGGGGSPPPPNHPMYVVLRPPWRPDLAQPSLRRGRIWAEAIATWPAMGSPKCLGCWRRGAIRRRATERKVVQRLGFVETISECLYRPESHRILIRSRSWLGHNP